MNRFGIWSIVFLITLIASIYCAVHFNGWWIVFPGACVWSFTKLAHR